MRVWHFEGQKMRTQGTYFMGMDVGYILGYRIPYAAIGRFVPDRCRRPENWDWIDEEGLFTLLFAENRPATAQFAEWLRTTVLPVLHEGDSHDDAPQNVPFDVLNRAIEAWEKERQARIALEKLQPSYKDIVANDPQEVTVTRIAKDYGWSAAKLNRYLQEHHVQEKKGGVWVLTDEYANKGYTHTAHTKIIPESGEPYERVRTYWTRRGRWFIYTLLKDDGIYPKE